MKLVALTLLCSLCTSAFGAYSFLAQGCIPIKRKFVDAHIECVSHGLIQATPDTNAKNDDLLEFIIANSLSYAYISANDMVTEGTFEWLTNGKQVTNTGVWHTGQPGNTNNEDCVNISFDGHKLAWDDVDCDVEANIICETTTDEGLALAKARIPILREAFERKYGVQPPVVNNGLPITPVF